MVDTGSVETTLNECGPTARSIRMLPHVLPDCIRFRMWRVAGQSDRRCSPCDISDSSAARPIVAEPSAKQSEPHSSRAPSRPRAYRVRATRRRRTAVPASRGGDAKTEGRSLAHSAAGATRRWPCASRSRMRSSICSRTASVVEPQQAISSRERRQPTQMPSCRSSVHTPVQGDATIYSVL